MTVSPTAIPPAVSLPFHTAAQVRRQVEQKATLRQVLGGTGVTLFRNTFLYSFFGPRQPPPQGPSPHPTRCALCSPPEQYTTHPTRCCCARPR